MTIEHADGLARDIGAAEDGLFVQWIRERARAEAAEATIQAVRDLLDEWNREARLCFEQGARENNSVLADAHRSRGWRLEARAKQVRRALDGAGPDTQDGE